MTNKNRKKLKILLGLFVIGAIGAVVFKYTPVGETVEGAIHPLRAITQMYGKSLDEARGLSDKDPMGAAQKLFDADVRGSAEYKMRCTSIFSRGDRCADNEDLPQLIEAQNASRAFADEIIAKQLSSDDARPLELLYDRSTRSAWYRDAAVKHSSDLIRIASKGDATPETLMLAGGALTEGRFIVKDSLQAIDFFERAWAKGHIHAAEAIYKTYLEMGDVNNAQLWFLRCIEPCVRTTSPKVPADAKLRTSIEAAAADPSILKLSTPTSSEHNTLE